MSNFEPTLEQQAIIAAELKSLAVIACPGSGKTATAVRRLAEVRRRLDETGSRSHVALLSFSNVAVDTFRNEYRQLRGHDGDFDRVVIQTMDSFITSFILRPHGTRAMGCSRTPYLVLGGEPFLASYRFGTDPQKLIGIDELALDLADGKVTIHRRFKSGGSKRLEVKDTELAKDVIRKLGVTGGYTYATGRLWARHLLKKEPRLTRALARRFSHILVDEAQDIGRFEGALLDLLSEAGCTISLIGDYHQSIYGFNFATGEYLRTFAARVDVLELPLTQNRRSLESIVQAANSLAGTVSKPFRTPPERPNGTFFWKYDPQELPLLMSAWVTALNASRYSIDEAAVLCRGNGLLAKLAAASSEVGQSAVKHFATAAIEREQATDISKVLDHCAKGVMTILSGLPHSFIADLKSMRGDTHVQTLRRLVWTLIRKPTTGIPLATLPARTGWLKQLKVNLEVWLNLVEQTTPFRRQPTWTSRVTAKELPQTGPLIAADIGQNDWSALRCGTVHSAKGEGLSAVMYLTDWDDLKALVNGTGGEEGRIGFVAVTRARDLFVVAIPESTSIDMIERIKAHGFAESDPAKLTVAGTQSI
ncbi:UvrD-helicase domain-containing protein [Burkholderia ubonensis]|uniref:UvrD-helicase domain-containing protein n=1 Tax=Burkholderia ubonensis TaxID=101571 RepID=UPI0007C76B22|nr:ATP-dependent helicase [Burkholderia ubonensis]